MPTTTNLAIPYPSATVPPDVPGDIYKAVKRIDDLAAGVWWAPQLGGGGGATIGANAVSEGYYFLSGKHLIAKGHIGFGSSASFGSNAAVIAGLPVGTINMVLSTGHGFYKTPGGALAPVSFTAANGTSMYIRPYTTGSAAGQITNLGVAFDLGTPPQQSELIFTLELLLA